LIAQNIALNTLEQLCDRLKCPVGGVFSE
jgi:DNA-binding Xre family transcriptional regulator